MNKQDHPHPSNQEHGMTENRTPLILLPVHDGTGRAKDFHERYHAQDNENRPDNFITFKYLAKKIPHRGVRLQSFLMDLISPII